jgi:hypothetical protein
MGIVEKILDPVVKKAGANKKQYKRNGQISIGSIISGKRKENGERSSTRC